MFISIFQNFKLLCRRRFCYCLPVYPLPFCATFFRPRPAPLLGPFFNPNQGFWVNAETSQPSGEIQFELSGTRHPVEVFFDERYVPHIFAENDTDLYYAQGYVTARDRLFQMELQARAAGGFLSEWLGDGLVEYDRNQRRLGLVYGAERGIESMMQDETMAPILQAYADGVNAYIRSLQYKSYPLEYKILNVEPEEWKPLKTALLLKYMTQMLAGRSSDYQQYGISPWKRLCGYLSEPAFRLPGPYCAERDRLGL